MERVEYQTLTERRSRNGKSGVWKLELFAPPAKGNPEYHKLIPFKFKMEEANDGIPSRSGS
jgi:hypothetical protein